MGEGTARHGLASSGLKADRALWPKAEGEAGGEAGVAAGVASTKSAVASPLLERPNKGGGERATSGGEDIAGGSAPPESFSIITVMPLSAR